MRLAVAAAWLSTLLPGALHAQGAAAAATHFQVRIENVSSSSALRLSNGRTTDTAISPGVWVVHALGSPLFMPGEVEPGHGLQALAEAGMVAPLVAALRNHPDVRVHGSFENPQGGGRMVRIMVARMKEADARSGRVMPPMLLPGQRFDFTVEARPGERLSLVMMLAESNDGLVATAPGGIALFDDLGRPTAGDVSAQLSLWDAGTEVNEEPGLGAAQGARQLEPFAGEREQQPVLPMERAPFGQNWPPAHRIVRVTLTPARK